jgi:nucleotidyltransferase/DNA polymerase involved in DNA repair
VTQNRSRAANRLGKEIRARILRTTGLTASAGVSYNKFLAKLASGQRKPNGQLILRRATATSVRGQAYATRRR